MDREELKKYLPHREPMLLVDEVEIDEAGVAHAKYRIKDDEFFCRGHFPGNPVMAGGLIIEALAQTGAVALLSMPENKGRLALFGGIKNAKFKGKVVPGDVLMLETSIIKMKGPVGVGDAKAYVDGKVVATAEITFMLA